MSAYSLIGAIIFLGIGIIELAILNRTLYPVLRWRHERAKTTQEHGIEPNRIMALIKIQSLIIMPVVGFLLGDRMKTLFG